MKKSDGFYHYCTEVNSDVFCSSAETFNKGEVIHYVITVEKADISFQNAEPQTFKFSIQHLRDDLCHFHGLLPLR